MYGAILGDILGSIYEFDNLKTEEPEKIDLLNPECYFTDDTVLTVAVADNILRGGAPGYEGVLSEWTHKYPQAGYGGGFIRWAHSPNRSPYNSWGNGSAMRVSPVGWAFGTLEETLEEAKRSAEVTHNHPEGIKGAQATAASIFMARTGSSKQEIKAYIEKNFGYDLSRAVNKIRPAYQFNESCQETVPEAIIVFLESAGFVHAIQLGISIGGDTDTLCAITGGIAEAFYRGIPEEYISFAKQKLSPELLSVTEAFRDTFLN